MAFINPTTGGVAAPALGLNRNAKDYWSQVQAMLVREEDDEFFNTYFPVQQQTIGQVNDPAYMTRQVDQARLGAQQGLEAAVGNRERMQRTYGLQPTAERQSVQARADSLRGAQDDVSAITRTVQQVRDRDWQTMTGTSSPTSGLLGG